MKGQDEAVKLAVIGCGHLGSYHLDKAVALQAEGVLSLVGAVDIDGDKRERASERAGVATFASLAALLESQRPTAVVVATPTETHRAVACEAIAAGCHVLVEKPLASSASDGAAIIDAAAAHSSPRLLQVGHTERFNPAIEAALSVADRPRYAVIERLAPFSGRSTDIDVILDLMIHDLDLVAALFRSELIEIRAIGVPIVTEAMDMASVRLGFADGAVAQLSASRASMEPSRKIRLFTQERYISIDSGAQTIKSVRRLPAVPGSEWPQLSGDPIEVPERSDDALMAQLRHFVAAIRGEERLRVDGAAGLAALAMAERINAVIRIPLADLPD